MDFTREDIPTIMDGRVVRYKFGWGEVSASRNGVMVEASARYRETQMTVNEIHRALEWAVLQFKQLARGLPCLTQEEIVAKIGTDSKIVIMMED